MQLGDYSAIKIEKINYFNYLVLAGLLLAALGVLFFYLRKRKYSN
jgi:LPXTG-motif cell wall-anchored protein